ncbi:MAG: prephenate dehydratase [Pseudomonadota bacterium]|nr:prephenate dehydratase [Pseudomonadota bacterium]MBU4121050.1 prephenate dehydratase [Pseudomonadota bacterium]
MNAETLENLRKEIERMDREIVRLLNERAAVSVEIGKIKHAGGREIYDPSREAMVYRHLEEFNDGILSEAALRGVFREILSASRFLQTPTTVAFLGPEASFTHQAALAHFGGGIAAVPTATIPEVFDEVERGKEQWGIVPVENSAEGSVKTTLDRLISTPLAIRAEVYLRVRHCLLSRCDDPDAIRKVYSHPQALAQCQGWLRTHLPGVSLVEVESTAGAARRVREDNRAAAVASVLAADTYGLNILTEGIEDNPANTTRFLVIGPRAGEKGGGITGRDKTSIIFGTPHVPGALHRSLAPFAKTGINLTRIESWPMRDRMWEYLFFADFTGHIAEEGTQKCLKELAHRTAFLKVLGSYPRGEEQP